MFASAYATTPIVLLQETSASARDAAPYISSRSSAGYTIACRNAPTASGSLTFDILTIG